MTLGQVLVPLAVFAGIVLMFDRLLVRPRGTVVQVLGSRLDLTRVGRLAQGLAVLVWAFSESGLPWPTF